MEIVLLYNEIRKIIRALVFTMFPSPTFLRGIKIVENVQLSRLSPPGPHSYNLL